MAQNDHNQPADGLIEKLVNVNRVAKVWVTARGELASVTVKLAKSLLRFKRQWRKLGKT